VLSEAPRVLAIRVDAVENGPFSEELVPVAPGRRRAEVLPGDVMQPQALVVTVDGPVDLDATDAAWFLCDFDCLSRWPDEVPSCDDIEVRDAPICLAGRGAAPEVVVPGEIKEFVPHVWPTLAVVTGLATPEETDACVAALKAREDTPFEACGLAIRLVAYGPDWRIFEEEVAQLDEGAIGPEYPVPLDVLRMLPPNAAPELSRVRVLPGDGAHDLSEPLRVPAGASIVITPDPDPVDRQLVITPVPGVPNAYQGDFERIELVFFASEEVALPEGSIIPTSWLELTVPSEPTSMTLWLVVTDRRAGRSWSRLDLEVVDP
jgi:hypothetical protein